MQPGLAACLCALHRKQGGQEFVPFGHPLEDFGADEGMALLIIGEASCPRLQVPASGLIDLGPA